MKKPIILMILDGYGLRDDDYGNAIHASKTPVMDQLVKDWPHTSIGASGKDVGLPQGQMGNSEVGHMNIGAGRIVYQEFTRISQAAEDGELQSNPVILSAMENARKNDKALHFMGLFSPGGVHSHDSHLYAMLDMAKKEGVNKVYVHAFTDGRDVPPESSKKDIAELERRAAQLGNTQIATIIGRYYAMDRDTRWERTQVAYDAIVEGKGSFFEDPVQGVEASYEAGVTDEFIKPIICTKGAELQKGDSVIFYNFRPDRARQLTRALVDPDFDGFAREHADLDLTYVTMTQYDATMPNVEVAFPPVELTHTFGEIISKAGLTQLRIAETEKYPHVTFFFNGGVETVYPGEDRALIPSPKVATYDLQPEMSAPLVTEEMLKRLDSGKYDVIILNFANCDMVGHTGKMDATIKAVETVDKSMGQVMDKALEMGGVVLVTADHGNADQLYEPDGSPFTAHTTNPVPLIVAGLDDNVQLVAPGEGRLSDLTPTMLEIMGLEKPEEMTGTSLLIKK